jgi:hypothetical protein
MSGKVMVEVFRSAGDGEADIEKPWCARIGECDDEALVGHGETPARALGALASGLEISTRDGGTALISTARATERMEMGAGGAGSGDAGGRSGAAIPRADARNDKKGRGGAEEMTAGELRELVEKMGLDPDQSRLCPGCNTNCYPLCGMPECKRFQCITRLLVDGLAALENERR